ncbi:PQQ-dependent catabolism-associated CXXCW motif protein [Pseudomonas sp. JS3066]|uniref:PQQ-dependent catabolism-associated CXXCW motif protein n=1 Tax=unclassified Pseudomonas TaxID=196821 RepID=UPI000EA8575C|nr:MULTISPECIES: PQQ-dependent catabolism-associated CXXCW motif protein [unclassified Pseudomonas]AYF86608.1 PQQ-dependent catabolism-associated CXXCW motif protein [Pseudomonas sp. DY-1]WVK95921.1 PQQ-dependent catabolism-associated CXXCW motif protein [Pseudomonas sp. JS3066]
MKRLLTCLACVALALPALASEAADTPLFSADGYRLTRYRSPTPANVESARTLDTAQLEAQLKAQPDTLLVDVYRRQWLQGRFIEDEPHANLPGSLWLANTGDGELSAEWLGYFSRHLRQASHGRSNHPLVFYCRSDCWLSWNAVKRAAALGYTNLYWYRDGIDAWEQAGLPLQPARPVPFP